MDTPRFESLPPKIAVFTQKIAEETMSDAVVDLREHADYHAIVDTGVKCDVRKRHQRYILWEVEPPKYLMGFTPSIWKDFFNWTHTFRRDSDIWEPWGIMNQIKPFKTDIANLTEESKKNTYLAKYKTKTVAWFVSNCSPRSGRDNFIKQLQKYVTVDVYGRCGPFKCDRSNDDCWPMIEKDYYFYFSGENSCCKDYITEKFYRPLQRNIIPIAYGGGRGTNDYYFAPKKSFINALDYKSPKDLADYLLELQTDHKEYVSYFWWKPFYNIWLGRWKKAHCDICDRLHGDKKEKIYPDMSKWWVDDAKCWTPY